MSTPESKLETMAAAATAEIAKGKALWQRWEPYAIGVICLIVGAIAGHKLL
jgi:hypothetical protein